jgi:hypothetical protein
LLLNQRRIDLAVHWRPATFNISSTLWTISDRVDERSGASKNRRICAANMFCSWGVVGVRDFVGRPIPEWLGATRYRLKKETVMGI